MLEPSAKMIFDDRVKRFTENTPQNGTLFEKIIYFHLDTVDGIILS